MDQIVYDKLKEVAKEGRKITYSDLVSECNLMLKINSWNGRNTMTKILTGIAKSEVSKGRPMITSLVIQKNKESIPADGFYKLANDLGLKKEGEDWNDLFLRLTRESWEYWRDKNTKEFLYTDLAKEEKKRQELLKQKDHDERMNILKGAVDRFNQKKE